MAHDESPREDLLREATALVERIELVPQSKGVTATADRNIVAGFRRNGAVSIFFSDDEAYHFNSAGELRRAYVEGLLYKAVNGQLVSLVRVRTAEQVELRSRQLTAAEQAEFIAHMANCLAALAAGVAANDVEITRQVPPDANVLHRLHTWLTDRTAWSIAARPNA